MIERIDQVQQTTDISCRRLCLRQGLPYSSLMRWRQQRRQGLPLVGPRGPARLPLNAAELWERVRNLPHRRRRTRGAPALFIAYRDQLSRCHVRALVLAVRQEVNRKRRAGYRRIEWLVPGVIWSMDDLERRDMGPQPVFWNNIQDLGSRYKFPPAMGNQLHSGDLATRLERLFQIFGAPLFMKRDNGGNLNGHEVDAVLAAHWVIPLNSPPHYPPYNGGIEKAQREFQKILDARRAAEPTVMEYGPLFSELINHELNHKPRPCLDGQCSCGRFFDGQKARWTYNRQQRKEVYHQILAMADEIRSGYGEVDDRTAQAIWRRAVETWMQANGLIRIIEPNECNLVFS